MMQRILKRISTDDLTSGMVLGADVIDHNGNILIPCSSVVTDKHIFRIKLYQIMSLVILQIDDENDDNMTSSTISVTEPQYRDFNNFNSHYTIHQQAISSQLDQISNGHPIDREVLLDSHNGVIASLSMRSNLFHFLHHIQVADDHTYTHSLNVALLCSVFGQWLNWPKDQLDDLIIAGLLHDIGKLQIDRQILNKPGKLTEDEFALIRRHPQMGYDMIKHSADISKNVKFGILMHHERINGSGYPLALVDDQIHDFAKLLAIADIYDAMTSHRTYRDKFSPFKVIQLFEQDSFGLLDISFLFTILDNLAHNYLGKSVRLSNGVIAEVIFIHNHSPSRPIVQSGAQMIDLMVTPDLSIVEVL